MNASTFDYAAHEAVKKRRAALHDAMLIPDNFAPKARGELRRALKRATDDDFMAVLEMMEPRDWRILLERLAK